MIEPLRLTFEVACPVEHAFRVWTSGISSWWPADHTVTGETGSTIVVEPAVGGRIYERVSGGAEHEWGEVTIWEPPTRLGYLWHLHRDRSDATQVDIRFVEEGAESTRIEIAHRGWERLGAGAQEWRERNHAGWQTLLPHYVAAVEHR